MSTRTEELAALYGEQYHEMPHHWRAEMARELRALDLWEHAAFRRIREEMLTLLVDIERGCNYGWVSVAGRNWSGHYLITPPGPAYGLCHELSYDSRVLLAQVAHVWPHSARDRRGDITAYYCTVDYADGRWEGANLYVRMLMLRECVAILDLVPEGM